MVTVEIEPTNTALIVDLYQYNTGTHRRPRYHGSFEPKFLDGRGSSNFGR